MNQPTVADYSPRMAALEQKRKLVRTLMQGTFAMRAAKTTYLPQHPAESEGVYKTRLEKTFLDNFVDLAISKAVGKIFAKPAAMTDIPDSIGELMDDLDRQGRDINSFMMDVANTAFLDGVTYVLADKPPLKDGATMADAKAAGVRPYAVHIKPSSVLEIASERIAGVETITRLRTMECVTERVGEWGEVEASQVRVLERKGDVVTWQTYRQSDDKDKAWVPHDGGTTAFKGIYLVPFYTNRCGFMVGEPGFQNVAESNLEHWQWKSEHAHALSMCCFGMYTAAGVEPDEHGNVTFHVGPGKAHTSTNPQTTWGVLETSGVGVTLAADTLKAIESRIETAGVKLRVENGGDVTATAAALDSEETAAGLKAVAEGFSDSLMQLLGYFAEMQGVELGKASAKFNTDFGARHGTDAGLVELGKARIAGDISREAYLNVLKWRGELDASFDIDADKDRLAQEGPALGGV